MVVQCKNSISLYILSDQRQVNLLVINSSLLGVMFQDVLFSLDHLHLPKARVVQQFLGFVHVILRCNS